MPDDAVRTSVLSWVYPGWWCTRVVYTGLIETGLIETRLIDSRTD